MWGCIRTSMWGDACRGTLGGECGGVHWDVNVGDACGGALGGECGNALEGECGEMHVKVHWEVNVGGCM